jgi:hypothetical protein
LFLPQILGTGISVGGRPLDIAFAPDQRYLLVANAKSSKLTIISLASDAMVKALPVGCTRPRFQCCPIDASHTLYGRTTISCLSSTPGHKKMSRPIIVASNPNNV